MVRRLSLIDKIVTKKFGIFLHLRYYQLVMKETEIFFNKPYGDKCDGCELLRKAMLPAGTEIIITCFATSTEGVTAKMKYTVLFNDETRSRGTSAGPIQIIDGACQVKEAAVQTQDDESSA